MRMEKKNEGGETENNEERRTEIEYRIRTGRGQRTENGEWRTENGARRTTDNGQRATCKMCNMPSSNIKRNRRRSAQCGA
jgi:hypothetical protein